MERDRLPDKPRTTPEKRKPNLDKLSFDDLQSVYERAVELARTTYTRYEAGFRSASGDVIQIRTDRGIYKLKEFPNNGDFNEYLDKNHKSVLIVGSTNKEEVISAAREMLEALGNRII